MHHALNPDQYRGVFGSDGLKYARDVDDIVTYGTSGRVGAFIAEAIQVHILLFFLSCGVQVLMDCNLYRELVGLWSWLRDIFLLSTTP